MTIDIVPYENKYDEQIRVLEQDAIQGKSIQLEIIKNDFLDRAAVFEKYLPLLGLDAKGIPIATCIGARTKMIVNGHQFDAGVGFEVKVSRANRNKGVGKLLAISTYKKFFKPEGLSKNFITLKASNIPVIRLVAKTISHLWLYDFVYLTIPTKFRVTNFSAGDNKKKLFSTTLFDPGELPASYYTMLDNDLGYFHTYKMYQLRIRRISFLYKLGIEIMRRIQPLRYRSMPEIMKPFRFASLFNHHAGNIQGINLALEQLENTGIDYLMVCCRKNDSIYRMLNPLSINTYGYHILSDFPLSQKDEVTIDVRCL
jgi:hypothetical protein